MDAIFIACKNIHHVDETGARQIRRGPLPDQSSKLREYVSGISLRERFKTLANKLSCISVPFMLPSIVETFFFFVTFRHT